MEYFYHNKYGITVISRCQVFIMRYCAGLFLLKYARVYDNIIMNIQKYPKKRRKMRNLYFVQINDIYESGRKNTYIPYAAGCIEAYCLKNPVIRQAFRFGKITYCRDDISAIVSRFDNPFLVLFSCSVWNTNFNLALAREIKRVYPDCLISLGGHHVSSSTKYLEDYDFVDIITHRSGEEPTEGMLECFALGKPLDGVPNLSFRNENGEIITTPSAPQTGIDYPSPYLEGIFDDILEDDIDFSVLFETNRGCPNSCAFCDWGALKTKVRLFPLEKVFAEIDWIADHKIDFIYCADANFCLFSRDEKIVDYIIEKNRKTGYPKFFHVNFTKNKLDFVFEISTRMVRCGLSKAQTISFQSMNPEVLKNIGRENMSAEHFRSLMTRFEENGISTYCELILGLPGETYDSFCDGICSLIENGQHFAINVYPCEILPNSEMGQKYYRDKFEIKSTFVPFRLMHSTYTPREDEITEYAEYATSTYSMTPEDWANALLFACCIQGMHNLGLLRAAAIFCRLEYGMPYREFYEMITGFGFAKPESNTGSLIKRIHSLCTGVIESKNAFVVTSEGTDNILWGFDELMFIEAYPKFKEILGEVKTLIEEKYGRSEKLDAVMKYQADIIKKINAPVVEITAEYDFPSYFSGAYLGKPIPLEKKDIHLVIHDEKSVPTFAALARETVWYGRNRREPDYTSGYYKIET